MNDKYLMDCIDYSGTTVKRFDGIKLFLSTGALIGNTINPDALEEITYINRPSRANIKVETGDIIFAKMQNTIKVLAITEETKDLIVSTGFFVVRPNEDVDAEFIFQYLNSDIFNIQKDKNCTGATQKALTNAGLSKLRIPDIGTTKQCKIGQILRLEKKMISLRLEQISILDKLAMDTFLNLFGDPILNAKKWNKYPLIEKCDIITGNTPPRSVKSYYGAYIEWIKSDNINSDNTFLTNAAEFLSEEGLQKGRFVEKDAVLMTCIAGSLSCIGNVAIADRKVAFNQQINAIIPKSGVSDVFYLYYLFRLTKSYLQSDVSMSLKGILNKGKLASLEFIFPDFAKQQQFSNIARKIEAQKSRLRASLAELEMTYKATLQKAFSDELF